MTREQNKEPADKSWDKDQPESMKREQPQTAHSMGYRESARGILEGKIKLHRHTADRLEALSKALPQELPPDADEALWELLLLSRS